MHDKGLPVLVIPNDEASHDWLLKLEEQIRIGGGLAGPPSIQSDLLRRWLTGSGIGGDLTPCLQLFRVEFPTAKEHAVAGLRERLANHIER